MPPVQALIAFATCFAIGAAVTVRMMRGTGASWEEWRAGADEAPTWLWILCGLGIPFVLGATTGPLYATVLWGLSGFGAPPLGEGMRRWWRDEGSRRLRRVLRVR